MTREDPRHLLTYTPAMPRPDVPSPAALAALSERAPAVVVVLATPIGPLHAAAIDEGVPAEVLTTSLYERFASRGEADFQNKLLSAMRFQFGGHVEKPAGNA